MFLLSPLRLLSPLHWLFAPLRWIRRIVTLAVLVAAGYLVVSGYQVVETARHLPASAAGLRRSRAVVVLGAPLVGSAPGPMLTDRLDEALVVFEAGRASRVVVTGPAAVPAIAGSGPGSGSAAGPRSVPAVARVWLIANGVPPRAIAVVTAPDVRAALSGTASLLGPGSRVIIDAAAVDALYLEHLAAGDGLRAQVSPAPGSSRSWTALVSGIGALWRESSAVAVGRFVGYGRVGWAGG